MWCIKAWRAVGRGSADSTLAMDMCLAIWSMFRCFNALLSIGAWQLMLLSSGRG